MITNQLSFGSNIQQKTDYVHNNPIEEGLVYKPEDYVYSSAIDYAGQKV
jgi:hypothetical protein